MDRIWVGMEKRLGRDTSSRNRSAPGRGCGKGTLSRRRFLGASAKGFLGGILSAAPFSRVLGANGDIRLGVVGIGSRVKIGGMGRNEIRSFRRIPGVRIVAICDVDRANLLPEAEEFKKRNESVATYSDIRHLFDDKQVDGVIITTPNHWHALATIWACQAGKDVYVQKPASHNIFEGRQMVEAARKYQRIVQCPTGSRSPNGHAAALDYVRSGKLGKVLAVRHVHFSARCSIGKSGGAQDLPQSVDYNLWSGPAAMLPLARRNLHYDWHWQWPYGDGELGNWGIHHLDGCRMFVGGGLPRHVMSIGGRFGYDDDGQTPNTLIVYYDCGPATIVSEFRGLPRDKSFLGNGVEGRDSWGPGAMDAHSGMSIGKIIQCEQGYVSSTVSRHAAFDPGHREIMAFEPGTPPLNENFIAAMRSRRVEDLVADVLEGHLSTTLVHLGNISYRLGKAMSGGEVRERILGNRELSEAYERFDAHLSANGIDLKRRPVTLGPMLTFDAATERFVGEFGGEANRLVSPEYRHPFIVPEKI